jgi:hypothetical protein
MGYQPTAQTVGLQEMVETDCKFYKQITGDEIFANAFMDWLFDRYREQASDTVHRRDYDRPQHGLYTTIFPSFMNTSPSTAA